MNRRRAAANRPFARLVQALRGDSLGGALLVTAAAVAVVWASSPWREGYAAIRDARIGPDAWHLNLTLGQWAADGLLAVFFFVVGLELKRELVEGGLRRPATAVVPIAAAVGGMLVPALLYLVVNLTVPGGEPAGWAVPVATDIAFAVAVLGLVGSRLPTAVRVFLLTLAVVDDLLAIVVIAVGYASSLRPAWLVLAGLAVAVFAVLVRNGVSHPLVLVPVAVLAWAFVHASGVHATVAGVALGLVVPATSTHRFERRWRPVSAGVAVPLFALFAAGVEVVPASLVRALADPVGYGVVLGLVLGKPLGILAGTWLVCRFRRVELAPGLGWPEVAAVGALAGVGFTVSLLVAQLAFGDAGGHTEHATLAVLTASVLAAVIGGLALRGRGAHRQAQRLSGIP